MASVIRGSDNFDSAIIAGAESITGNGYKKFGDLIIQWGYVPDTGTTQTITYPTAFTTAVYSVQLQMVRNSANYQNTVINTAYATSLTSITYIWDSAADGVLWLAIGK